MPWKRKWELQRKTKAWEMVVRPKEKKTLSCKWVYTVKFKADGTIERYKIRLVVKGYTQIYGVDYQETFTLVAKMNTARLLLSLVVHFGWEI